MRRPRQRLQVQTFPFLAVLLCTMGSLILLLLVIDRRAKAVARAKALQSAHQSADDQAKAEAKSAADRKAEWERKRQELRQRRARQEQDLTSQIHKVQNQSAAAAGKLLDEEERLAALRQHLRAEETLLNQDRQSLQLRRAEVEKAEGMKESARKEAERLATELAQLEQVLAGLKALRQKEQQTYSVVPYLGRNGENRRPIYVECAASGVIFHPDRLSLGGPGFTPLAVRQELDRRLEAQRRSGPQTAPYLLLLVRPDGLENYYVMQSAVAGLKIDFGYELIDQDWVLDFSDQGQLAQGSPRRNSGPGRDLVQSPASAGTRGTSAAGMGLPGVASLSVPHPPGFGTGQAVGNTGSGAGVGFGSVGLAGRLGPPSSGGGGNTSGNAGTAKTSLGGGWPSPGFGPDVAQGPVLSAPGELGSLRAEPPRVGGPSSQGQGQAATGSSGASWKAVEPPCPGGLPGASAGLPGNAGAWSSAPGSGSRQSTGAAPALIGDPTVSGSSPGPPSLLPPVPGGNSGQAPRGMEASGAGPPSPVNSGQGAGQRGQGGTLPGQKDNNPDALSEEGGGEPAPMLAGPVLPPLRNAVRKSAIPLGRLTANRDWIITLECQADQIVLLSTDQAFPAATLRRMAGIEHPLTEVVRGLIDRRQATLRPGEPPYRPVLRFRVHADGLKTYYAANALLDDLHLATSRENVENAKPALPDPFRS
jgi:hypothetical protein